MHALLLLGRVRRVDARARLLEDGVVRALVAQVLAQHGVAVLYAHELRLVLDPRALQLRALRLLGLGLGVGFGLGLGLGIQLRELRLDRSELLLEA